MPDDNLPDKYREDFEDWFRKEFNEPHRSSSVPECYNTVGTQMAWEAFQAGINTRQYTGLERENERLREALKFYADEKKYFGTISENEDSTSGIITTKMEWPIYQDGGETARQALKETT